MSFRHIRMWLVAGLLLPAALVLTPARAQFGRPPVPPGGIVGRPGINGGIGGINGGIGGINGGIGGMPAGINGGVGGIPGPPKTEWVCSHCGKVVSTSPVKPFLSNCPFCGVKFSNGIGFGPPAGFNPPAPPVGGIGGMPQPPGGVPNIPPTEPAHPPQPPAPPINPPDPPAANNNFAPAPVADPAPLAGGSSKTTRTVIVVGAIGCGVLLLFAALGTFLYISATRATKDAPAKRRRKRVYHDENDDG